MSEFMKTWRKKKTRSIHSWIRCCGERRAMRVIIKANLAIAEAMMPKTCPRKAHFSDSMTSEGSKSFACWPNPALTARLFRMKAPRLTN